MKILTRTIKKKMLKNMQTGELWAEIARRHEEDNECILETLPSYLEDLAHDYFTPDLFDVVDTNFIDDNFDTEEIWAVLEKKAEKGCIASSIPDSINSLARDYYFEDFEDDIDNFTKQELLDELFEYRDTDLDEILEILDIDINEDEYLIRELFNCSTYSETEYVKEMIAKIREALINFTYMKIA